ncbi:family 43 glycosylhydrolase [Oerskovia sp. M15]
MADSPEGPFTAQATPMITNGEAVTSGQAIDPAAFEDPATGKFYLFWGNGSPLFAELGDDMVSVEADTIQKISGLTNFREGLFLNYREGLYHLTYSIDDTGSENYRVGYATSTSVGGPWTYRGVILEKDASQGILGTGHSSIVQVPGPTSGTSRTTGSRSPAATGPTARRRSTGSRSVPTASSRRSSRPRERRPGRVDRARHRRGRRHGRAKCVAAGRPSRCSPRTPRGPGGRGRDHAAGYQDVPPGHAGQARVPDVLGPRGDARGREGHGHGHSPARRRRGHHDLRRHLRSDQLRVADRGAVASRAAPHPPHPATSRGPTRRSTSLPSLLVLQVLLRITSTTTRNQT